MTEKKTWITPRGERLLRKVQRAILDNPRSYRQDTWHCGTAMCIAGHVAFISGKADGARKARDEDGDMIVCPVKKGKVISTEWTAWAELAATALNGQEYSTENPLYDLFEEPNSWPEPFSEQFTDIDPKDYVSRAALAAVRIEHFIRTGE